MAQGNASSNAIRLAEILEDPEAMAMLQQVLGGGAGAGGGRVPNSFLTPGTMPFAAQRPGVSFDQWSIPSTMLQSAGVPQVQPVQGGGAFQFLGGSPTPVNGVMRTAALMSLGTNLLEAARSIQRTQSRRRTTTSKSTSTPTVEPQGGFTPEFTG